MIAQEPKEFLCHPCIRRVHLKRSLVILALMFWLSLIALLIAMGR